MSGALISKQLNRSPKKDRLSWTGVVRLAFRFLISLTVWPFRVFRALRRSLTAASVSVMLITLMTFNVIWGYPWTGMMAACVAVLAIGWFANYALRPKLLGTCSLPASVPARQPLRLVAHIRNQRRLPAMDVCLGFDEPYKRLRKRLNRNFDASPWDYFGLIKPSQHVDHHATLTFQNRGVHALPPIIIQSTFPFFLFRWRGSLELDAEIAVTPALLDGDQDVVARRLLSTIGGWAHRLLAGNAVEYTGSREYQVGMPVRRWDFASWARLGRPIVREYESPNVCSIALIVDAASLHDPDKRGKPSGNDKFERLLSLAATAITDLVNRSVQIDLTLTSENETATSTGEGPSGDTESLLIRLAKADLVDRATADLRIQQALDRAGRQPTLLLTCRQIEGWLEDLPSNVTLIHADENVTHPSSAEAA